MSDDKTQWTLELIESLLEARIGNPSRLGTIKSALENRRQIYRTDKQYLKEKFRELQEKEHQTSSDKPQDFAIGYPASQDKSTNSSEDDYSIMILKNRLAMGEISTTEFDTLKAKITQSGSDKKDSIDATLNELVDRIQRLEKRTDSLEAGIKRNSDQDGIQNSIKLTSKK
jgi:hypothetical protein